MPIEYQVLASFTIFFLFAWLPGSIGKWKSYGPGWINSNRSPVQDKELLPWAGRCDRAYSNLKDYFPAFLAAILLLGILNKFDESTTWASLIYVSARLMHFLFYALGNVPLRALSYFLSIGANLYLLAKIF